MECFIPVQIQIITDVVGPTLKVLCGYNLCKGDEMDRVGNNRKKKLDYLLQL